jgi:hypothetical protein
MLALNRIEVPSAVVSLCFSYANFAANEIEFAKTFAAKRPL